MLLLTLVYDGEEDIINEIANIKDYFKSKDVNIGISESITNNTHFIKIFYSDEEINNKTKNSFNYYIANILYKIVLKEFYNKDMYNFLMDTYFFLKNDEINEVAELSMKALKGEGGLVDESSIYCMNRRNNVINKIIQCLEENSEININGFITFRMKELLVDLESIVDKVVEKYMVDKEYSEFIKLLKYFVEVQDSRIAEVNIVINSNGEYSLKNEDGKNIIKEFLIDLSESKINSNTNMDDIIISGLITSSPERIKIHCVENCRNKELIETIKNVFTDRVTLCNNCNMCSKIKSQVKI